MGNLSANFDIEEWQCSCPCKSRDISMDLVNKVQTVRHVFDRPMRITSGVRCSDFNASIGASPSSSHVPLNGRPSLAVDLFVGNSADRFRLLQLALHDFSRVGVSKEPGFIHLDIDEDKSQRVLWLY